MFKGLVAEARRDGHWAMGRAGLWLGMYGGMGVVPPGRRWMIAAGLAADALP